MPELRMRFCNLLASRSKRSGARRSNPFPTPLPDVQQLNGIQRLLLPFTMLLASSVPPSFLPSHMLFKSSSPTTSSSPKPPLISKRNSRQVPKREQAEVDFPWPVKSTVKPSMARRTTGSLLGLYTLMHVSTSPLTERRRSAYMRDAYICPFKGEALERRIF